jgi:phosphoglycolate phosphatase-like HAD superfamily hydrolase
MAPKQRNRGAVLFDPDGTLLDTSYLQVVAWWEAFRERGHDVRCADIHRAVGLGSGELIQRVLGKGDPSVSDAHSRYYAPYLGRMRPLPGARELLVTTAKLGLSVVVATSAKGDEVGLMLDALDVGSAITSVVSSADVDLAKPDPGIVERALTESRTAPGRAVMVGDTIWDVIAARRAGVPCIGLLSGGIEAEQLRDAGAAEIYRDAAALLEDLTASGIGRLAH